MIGNKGKNLQKAGFLLEEFNNSKLIKEAFTNLETGVEIPYYITIDSSLYKKYKERGSDIGNIFQELKNFFYNELLSNELINIKNYIVRSSGVYAEDNKNLTGAGIYRSYHVDFFNLLAVMDELTKFKNSSSKGKEEMQLIYFVNAVSQVFESVGSDKAKEYRKQHGIEQEELGIVIQNFIEYDETYDMSGFGEKHLGIANSVVKNQPNKLSVSSGDISHILYKEPLINHTGKFFTFDDDEVAGPLDYGNFSCTPTFYIAQLLLFLEKKFGGPIQIEYVYLYEETPFSPSKEMKIYLLQVRYLPEHFLETKKISLNPEEKKELVFEGQGLGIGRYIGKVLNRDQENSKKEGVLVDFSSHGLTLEDNPISFIPKKGAVFVLGQENVLHSHFGTLCAENDNIITVFNSKNRLLETDSYSSKDLVELFSNLQGKEIEVVSDGNIGRVYI